MASEFQQHRLLSRSLHQWQLSTRWSKDVGWKEDLAFEHRCSSLLLKCMAGWDMVCFFYCIYLSLHIPERDLRGFVPFGK